MTAQLLSHVQNFIAIILMQLGWKQNEALSNFNFGKIVCEMRSSIIWNPNLI